MASHQAESEKNQQAENQHVRKSVWGYEGKQGESKSDDDAMGHTILGDVNHPAPVVISQAPSNLLPIALLALAAAIPATGAIGVAGYLLANRNQPPPAATQPGFDDSTVKIGLGRIEDLEQGLNE